MVYLHLFLIIPVVLAILFLVLNHIFAWSYFRQYAHRYPASNWAPSVSIIVPVRGVDEFATENFRGLCQQAYPNDYEIIFAVEDQDDPAVPVIQRIKEEYADVRSRLVFSGLRDMKAAGKIKNLIAGYAESLHEVIIFLDSDIYVPPTFLLNTVRGVESPEVGLAFAVPVCEGTEDWVAALHNVAVNASALHYASAAFQNRLYSAAGSVMAMRREVVEKIGGLEQIGERIVGIDISIGQAVCQAGYTIHLLKQPARSYHAHDNLKRFWWQMHRWMVTIRRYYPAFPLLLILAALPLWWSFLFLGMALLRDNHVQTGLFLVLLVFVVQLVSAATINAKLVKDAKLWRFLWIAGLSELVALPILVHSMLSDKVVWRGRWLRINRDLTASYLKGRIQAPCDTE